MRIWEFQEIAPPRVGAISWKPPQIRTENGSSYTTYGNLIVNIVAQV